MNEPTAEQLKRFWEWCGWLHTNGLWKWDKAGEAVFVDDKPPFIDLNNLFKYAVPKVIELGYEVILFTERDGYEVEINDVDIPARKQSRGAIDKDPALALFWAIYKVMEGK